MTIKLIADLGYAVNCKPTTSTFHGITVYPTFFFDNASMRQKASAETWAGGNKVIWTGSRYIPDTANNPSSKVRPNVPMTNLWLDNLETRMEGGRAYKVINKDDFTYFDVREDQMLQAILKYGIQAGGKIGGSWVFAMNGTQCKCFLVDGKEYQEAVARSAITPTIMVKASYKNLKVGNVYSNKNADEEFIYVGFFGHKVVVTPERRDYNNKTVTPAVYKLQNKHAFVCKVKWWYDKNTPAPFVLTTPSTVYETGRSMSIPDLTKILKEEFQAGYHQEVSAQEVISSLEEKEKHEQL